MSAALAHEAVPVDARRHISPEADTEAAAETLGEKVIELVRLAGGRLETWAFEPAALLLVRAGALDGAGLTFGSDYDLHVRSRELRRGFVEALGSGRLAATSSEMWLTQPAPAVEPADDERSQFARTIFALPRLELEQTARRQLLGE